MKLQHSLILFNTENQKTAALTKRGDLPKFKDWCCVMQSPVNQTYIVFLKNDKWTSLNVISSGFFVFFPLLLLEVSGLHV